MKLIFSNLFLFLIPSFCFAQSKNDEKMIIKLEIKTVEINGRKIMVDQNGNEINCILPILPTFTLSAPDEVIKGDLIVLVAFSQFLKPNLKIKYKWQISDGKIIDGQGTEMITLETKNIISGSIRVTVIIEIKGKNYPKEILKYSTITKILPLN